VKRKEKEKGVERGRGSLSQGRGSLSQGDLTALPCLLLSPFAEEDTLLFFARDKDGGTLNAFKPV
jgi:hypothetical protein